MLTAYMHAGLDGKRFWEITPRTYIQEIEAAIHREERDLKKQKVIAWLNASFQRAKKLPKLAEVLGEQKKLTHDQVVGHLKSLSHGKKKRSLEEWLLEQSSAPSVSTSV